MPKASAVNEDPWELHGQGGQWNGGDRGFSGSCPGFHLKCGGQGLRVPRKQRHFPMFSDRSLQAGGVTPGPHANTRSTVSTGPGVPTFPAACRPPAPRNSGKLMQ